MERGDVFTKVPVVRSDKDGKTHCIGSVFLSPRDSEESAVLKIGEQLGPGLAPLLFELVPHQLESPSIHPGDRPRVLPGWLSEHDSVLLAEATECAVSIQIEHSNRPQVSALISSQHTFDCLRRSLAVWLDCDQVDLEIVDDQGQVWRSSDRVISTISQRWRQFGRTVGAQQGDDALLLCKFSRNDAVGHRVILQDSPSGVRLPPILLSTASLAKCGATQTQLSSVYLLPSSARSSIRSRCRDFEHAREHVGQLLRSLDLTKHSDAGAASGAGGEVSVPKHAIPWAQLNVRILAAHCSGLEDLRIVGGLAAGGTATADVSAEDRAHAELLSAMGQFQVRDTKYEEEDKAPEGPRPATSGDAPAASLPIVRRTAALATSGSRHSRLPSTTLLQGICLSIESLPRAIPRSRVSIDEEHHEDAALDALRTAHARPRRGSPRHSLVDVDAVRACYNLLAAAAAPHRARARRAGPAGTLVEQLEAAWPLLASAAVVFHQYPATAATTRASALCAQVRSRLAPAAVKHATSGCATMQRLARMVSPAASARRLVGSKRSGAAASLANLGSSGNDTQGLQLEGEFMPAVQEAPVQPSDGAVGGSAWMKQVAVIFAAWSWYDRHRARVPSCIAEFWCAELESASEQTIEATVLCTAGCMVSCHLFAETEDSARRIPPISLARQNAGAGFWAALLGCAMAMYKFVCSSGGARKNITCSGCCSAMRIPGPAYGPAEYRSNAGQTASALNAAKLAGSPGSRCGDTLVIQGSFMAPPRRLLECTPSSSKPSASAAPPMAQPGQRGQQASALCDQQLSASITQQTSRTQSTTLVDREGGPAAEPAEGMRLPRVESGKAIGGASQQLPQPTTPRRTVREPGGGGVAVAQDTVHPTGTSTSDPAARGALHLPTRQDVSVGQISALGLITACRSTPLSSIAELVRRVRWVPASSRSEALRACGRHSISGCGHTMHHGGLLTVSSARLLHECKELSSLPLQAIHAYCSHQSTFGALAGCPFEEVIQLKVTKAFRAAMQPVTSIAKEAGRGRTVIDSVVNRSDRESTPGASVAGAREVVKGAQVPAETGSQGQSYGQHVCFMSSIGDDSGTTWRDSPQERTNHGQTRILSGRVLPADLVDALQRSIMSKRRAAWSITLRLLSVEAETALDHARSTKDAGEGESLVAQCCRESEALIDQLLDGTSATHALLGQCSSISQCWAKHIAHHESRAVDAFNALFDDEQSYFGFQEFVREKLPDQWPRVQSLLEILDIESQWKEAASILDQISISESVQKEQASLDRAQEIVCQCIAGYILVGLQLQHLEGTVDDLSKQRLLLLGPLIGVAFVRPSYTEEVLQALGIQAGDIDSMLTSEQQLPVLGSVFDPLDQDSLGRDRTYSVYNAQSSGLQAFHMAVKCLGGGAMHVNLCPNDNRRRMPPPPSDVFRGIAEQMCDYVLKNVAPDWLESREGQLALARRVPASPTSKGESANITTDAKQEKETDLSLTDT